MLCRYFYIVSIAFFLSFFYQSNVLGFYNYLNIVTENRDVKTFQLKIFDNLENKSSTYVNSQNQFIGEVKSEREKLEALVKNLNESIQRTATSQMFLSSNYFTIFLALLTIAGLISGIFSTLFIRGAQTFIKKQVTAEVEKQASSMIKQSSHVVIARAHSQQAWASWENYSEEFIKFLKNKTYDKTIIKDVSFAVSISTHGINELEKIKIDKKKDRSHYVLLANLENHWVYSKNVELLLLNEVGRTIDDSKIDEVLDRAKKCLEYSNEKIFKDKWYYFAETAYLCFWKHGDAIQRQEAIEKLLLMLDGKCLKSWQVPPTEDWVNAHKDQYFPINVDTGQRQDIHGFGRIPKT